MGCEVRRFPVTDILSDHSLRAMNQTSSPQRRKEETVPVRSPPPCRERSREDSEIAQHLVDHSQGLTKSGPGPNDKTTDTPSPSQELRYPESTSTAQEASSPASVERGGRESSQSCAPLVSQNGAVPSGQICRYVRRTFDDIQSLNYAATVRPVEHLYGGGHHKELPFATRAVFIGKLETRPGRPI